MAANVQCSLGNLSGYCLIFNQLKLLSEVTQQSKMHAHVHTQTHTYTPMLKTSSDNKEILISVG